MQECKQQILNLYQKLYGPQITITHLNELAGKLSQSVHRKRPWTGKYLHSLIKGYAGFTATASLRQALIILAGRQDEVQIRAQETTVLSLNPLPLNTIVLGQAQRCANPHCSIIFVPTNHSQKYHSKSCAQQKH